MEWRLTGPVYITLTEVREERKQHFPKKVQEKLCKLLSHLGVPSKEFCVSGIPEDSIPGQPGEHGKKKRIPSENNPGRNSQGRSRVHFRNSV